MSASQRKAVNRARSLYWETVMAALASDDEAHVVATVRALPCETCGRIVHNRGHPVRDSVPS